MSVRLIAWAYQQNVGSMAEKAVLVALADAANGHTGRCHPSVERLAKFVEANEKTVRRALQGLEEKGYIQRSRARDGEGRLGNYSYTFALDFASQPPDTESGSPPGTESALEPEVDLEPEGPLAAAAPRAGVPNPIWDALTEIFGEATTETARSRRGKVCRSLKNARASPEEIIRRARAWPKHFENATLTELALEKHWDVLGRPPLRLRT